jgi:hypothetical protein
MAARKKAAPTRMQKAGNGHSYYLDGEKVPGVTTILSNGIPKPALVGWGAGTVADFVVNRLNVARTPEGNVRIVADDLVRDALAWNETRERKTKVGTGEELPRLALADILKNVRYRDLDEASNKGSTVHALAERLARGEEIEVPELLAGHVAAYVAFLNEWQPTGAILERVVINRRWRYMGKFDMIADFPGVWSNGPRAGTPVGRGLVDIKTSRSGIFAEVALQLEAYRNAETMIEGAGEVPMPVVDWVGAIHVRSDGYDVFSFETDPSTFRTFLYAKQVGEWLDWKEGPAATIRSDALTPPVVR